MSVSADFGFSLSKRIEKLKRGLLTLTYSEYSYTRYLPFRRRNWSRKATTVASVEHDEQYENAWHSVA